MSTDQINELTAALIEFRDARDWKQFHNPKDLAAALSIEAAELQELFLWKNASDKPKEGKDIARIREEVADIASFLLLFCESLDINLFKAVKDKIILNDAKYPASIVKGSSEKYTEYNQTKDQ